MAQPILSRRAESDLTEILLFIARDKPSAASSFLSQIEERFALLGRHPSVGEARSNLGSDVRSFTFGNYAIFFRALGQTVEIIRVLHGSRDIRSLDS